MRILTYLLPAFLIFSFSLAQDLSVDLIPVELKENADAVIRFDDTEFFIEKTSESNTKRHWAITILNERGAKEHGTFMAYYDKFSKIRKIEGVLYDAQGKVLKKLAGKDIEDYGYGAFGDDITDNRIKLASFAKFNVGYPYTVEFSFEKQNKNMMLFPSWIPQSEEKTAVVSSSFKIYSVNIPFRIKEISVNKPEIKSSVAHPFIKEWTMKNAKSVEFESYSNNENLARVLTAPMSFEIEEYKGNMNSWEDIGRFYSKLNKGRDELPEDTKNKLAKLINPQMSTAEKVKTTYEFMQSHTRYMSIQLGIGGWQSMLASEVATKGYGDCKALSNYTVALLKSIGIKAYPVLIKAGTEYDPDLEDFPSMKFNHAIACVPTPKDTIWLECTSQTNPMGYMGNFTGNRKALIVTENGGQLVSTKWYGSEDNFQRRSAEVWIKEDGEATVEINSIYGGIQQEKRSEVLNNLSQDEQRKFLNQSINISSFDLGEFNFKLDKKAVPEVKENASLTARKLVSVSGKRLFLKPNILSGFYKTLVLKETRETNLFLDPNVYSIEDSDEITFHLPEGYKTEKSPEGIQIESPFGVYSASIVREGDILTYYRKVTLKGGIYDKSIYTEWVEFLKSINRADKDRIVFVKEGT